MQKTCVLRKAIRRDNCFLLMVQKIATLCQSHREIPIHRQCHS